jgi:hypothetical protein
MKNKQYQENIILGLAIICILMIIGIFKWGDYLINNNFIKETFYQNLYTNHNVNLPINTTYQCTNFCGPPGRCSKTGQQCLADIDCPGCQPYSPPLPRTPNNFRGENDAGKLSSGQFLSFSQLTTDLGTQAKRFYSYKNKNIRAPEANFGPNLWRSKFNEGDKLYNERYVPQNLTNMSKYPYRFTMSGEFLTNGPLASNAYFS